MKILKTEFKKNIMRAYELKFGPNLGCRTEILQILIPCRSQTFYSFSSKWGSNELNDAATGDLKNGRRGVKVGS